MWKLFALLTVFTLATVLVVNADNSQVDDAVNKVKETAEKATTIEEGSQYCPTYVPGAQKCPPSNIFYQYQCCGTLNKDCCFKLQMWVYIVLGVIAFLILLSLAISLIRCLFCRH
ncbi:unnamed protein product [Enterobius vermicularis]|uniref:CX domain-containing protein n=1 Tax=Enterobius vermicularis TaxID=51028 RepID=A0A0N4VF28_ENTVE|nr:unnamed protein product [Enterobius vermicularis]